MKKLNFNWRSSLWTRSFSYWGLKRIGKKKKSRGGIVSQNDVIRLNDNKCAYDEFLIIFWIMSSESIKVVCRLRPLNKIEIANSGEECVTYTAKDITINVQKMPNRSEEKNINTTFPLIASSAPAATKLTSTRKCPSPSSKQSLAVLTVPSLPMGRLEEARPGPWKYSSCHLGPQSLRPWVQGTDSSYNWGFVRCNFWRGRECGVHD